MRTEKGGIMPEALATHLRIVAHLRLPLTYGLRLVHGLPLTYGCHTLTETEAGGIWSL